VAGKGSGLFFFVLRPWSTFLSANLLAMRVKFCCLVEVTEVVEVALFHDAVFFIAYAVGN